MKKFSTTFLVFALIAALFIGCSHGNQANNVDYDTAVFSVPMKEALRASQDFVKQSVKSSASRSAFVELEEDDKWEGFIYNGWGNNWNVPSSIYGTSLTTADNTLVINGEELGALQELVFHKEKINGQDCFTKAVFEYKGYVYYVLDTANGNTGGYIVLSTEDDLNHICFTQDGKIGSKDFSNFKIWTWVKGSDGKLYRDGNLGYAYTLRNVQMRDGSYATVTVSGYNYYNYGLRVWIQETDGKTTKKNYPNTVYTPDYEPKTDMSKYFANPESSADFIFEITNKTDKTLVVANYIKDSRINDSTLTVVTKTTDTDLAPGDKKVFKYSADAILADFDDNYIFCNYCYEKDSQYKGGAWYYYLGDYIKNQRVVVAQTNANNNGGEKHAYYNINFVSTNSFVVNEQTETVDGVKYYTYSLADVKAEYETYYNQPVYYSDGKSVITKFTTSCKSKIEQLLNAGNFEEPVYDNGQWYEECLLLKSNPQQ